MLPCRAAPRAATATERRLSTYVVYRPSADIDARGENHSLDDFTTRYYKVSARLDCSLTIIITKFYELYLGLVFYVILNTLPCRAYTMV